MTALIPPRLLLGSIVTQATDASRPRKGLTYADAGVDVAAGAGLVKRIGPLARATARPGAEAGLGGFAGLFDPKAAGFRDPVLLAATDGVGTKLLLARDCGQFETIGIDLVAMSVNDLVVQGATPLVFLDYFACGKLDAAMAERVVRGIAEGCKQAGCALIGGETAEMPDLYPPGDFDLAGFCVGAAERGTLIDGGAIRLGDAVLGLASSGVHANGYSLVRKVAARAGLAWDAPAPFDPARRLGAAFLEPTRIYTRPVLDAVATGQVHGLVHITGGGFPENLPRVLKSDDLAFALDPAAWPRPALFDWLARAGGIAEDEMLATFNCGIGMVVVCAADQAEALSAVLTGAGESVHPIGRIAARGGGPAVRFDGRV